MLTRAFTLLVLSACALGAQDAVLAVLPPNDSALARARRVALDGNVPEARRVIDSVLQANAADPARYSEALFWRAALAATAADAERDYGRLLVEAPLSDRAEDALLQLAQLEQARGNRKSASDRLYLYMLSYGNSPDRPARPRVSLWLVRLLFEQDQTARGCSALGLARDAVPPENVELRNQLEAYTPRCTDFEVAGDTPAPAVDAPAPKEAQPSPRPARPSAERPPATAPAVPRSSSQGGASHYSVQVAAYDSREAAERMAELLVSRGLAARVDGTARPFRVRVGRYATRAEAVKAAQALKAQGQNGFIALVTPGR